jgi:hypothetical protein
MTWPYLTRGDIGGVVLLIVILGGVLFASIKGPQISQKTNYGFGPEWVCASPGKGGPICVKHPATKDNSN